ncbi:MAG: hypothetical protein H6Q69_2007 [Firmicutes bacterium]|nr:hypothetical protein [Bacillota bacterium]
MITNYNFPGPLHASYDVSKTILTSLPQGYWRYRLVEITISGTQIKYI